jgi:hypothetical protein
MKTEKKKKDEVITCESEMRRHYDEAEKEFRRHKKEMARAARILHEAAELVAEHEAKHAGEPKPQKKRRIILRDSSGRRDLLAEELANSGADPICQWDM